MVAALPVTDLDRRKALGQEHLIHNRIEEAQVVFAGVLRANPEDAGAYLLLGDCYLVDGDFETAALLYNQALALEPDDPAVRKRRREIGRLMGASPAAAPHKPVFDKPDDPAGEPVPADPQAVAALLQRLAGLTTTVTEADVFRAAELLERVIHSSQPALAVAEHLEEVDALIPALLALNIRQANLDGRPDLASALQALMDNILLQLELKSRPPGGPETAAQLAAQPAAEARRLLFISPSNREISLRQTLPAEALSALGCEVTIANRFPADFQEKYDLIIAHQPHGDPELMQGLAACAATRTPIILDLEADFEQMPVTHPDYAIFGIGTQANLKAYTAALMLADQICVPSESFAGLLRANGHRVRVIPDGWSRQNGLWDKSSAQRQALNLGWTGLPGQVDDVGPVRRVLIRLMREFPQVNLIIAGDPQVYHLFGSLPEARRLFLPPVRLEDYPYLLGQIDILISPQRNTPFNKSLSDRKLMEAGIRRIPWVASPIPAYLEWGAGGLIARSAEEWHTHLRQLILDAGLRTTLGLAGRGKAEGREMSRLSQPWLQVVNETCRRVAGVNSPLLELRTNA